MERLIGSGAGDAMVGGGGTAVVPAAACAYVVGVERGEPDGGDGADIEFFETQNSKAVALHAFKTRENKPTQVHMHIVRQYQTIQVYQVIFVPGGTMHSRVLPHTSVWHKCM